MVFIVEVAVEVAETSALRKADDKEEEDEEEDESSDTLVVASSSSWSNSNELLLTGSGALDVVTNLSVLPGTTGVTAIVVNVAGGLGDDDDDNIDILLFLLRALLRSGFALKVEAGTGSFLCAACTAADVDTRLPSLLVFLSSFGFLFLGARIVKTPLAKVTSRPP